MLTSLVPVGKATVFLQAAAVKRVLCTSEDFNTLIYTAINIQAMNVTEGARNLLVEDTVQQRMEELIKGSEKSLASTYSRAFSHLLLGGQSAELFVEREERHLYQMEDSFPRMPKYYEEPHPLKERVGFILDALNACTESPDVRPVNFEETVFYFELLKLILDEKSDNQELSEWLDRVLQKQEPSKVSTPLIISLVACTVRMLNVGFKSASASPELRQEGQGGRERSDRDRFLSVQGERVEIAKQLIGTVGWEIQIVPSDSWWSFRRSVLGLIEIALTKRHQSPRQPEKSDIWLLEQALSLSTTNRHERNWESVAKSAVALLRSSDNPEDPTPDSASAQDTHKDNRLRCANILCQCVQAMRDHLKPDEFIRAVSPALDELEKYWERFKDDFNQNPDLKDVAMLGKWLEIRDALDKPEESGWGYGRHQQFSEAYPSLKAGFDVIASALQENETVPNAERNPGELPRVADLDKKTEQKELRSAVTDRATPKSDEHVHNPLVAVGGSQRDRGAREPNAKQQDEGRRQPSV
ncbi:hypothetical protein FRC01_009801 [Tulasnella sp. 417]|nr:hypothetical protein FRC01_009801 [Tulasnella sp. 417]